jgi:hypothetical protein
MTISVISVYVKIITAPTRLVKLKVDKNGFYTHDTP